MSTPVDLSARRFGHWIPLRRVAPDRTGHTTWLCVCDCGTQKAVRQENLLNGQSRSCGCQAHEKPREHRYMPPKIARGSRSAARKAAYHAWYAAVRRCTNPDDPAWPRYGGRGIAVCPRWLDFENFLADMGERPPGMSLERKNNDLGYNPANCCWATMRAQARNRRGVKLTPELLRELLSLHKEGTPADEVARQAGLSYKTTTLAIWIAETLAELHP